MLRPRQAARVTVHFEASGAPLYDVAVVVDVSDEALVLQRTGSLRKASIQPGTDATVLFTQADRVFHWHMRVEEILPSSFFLRPLKEPGDNQRRQFVRACVPMGGRLKGPDDAEWLLLTEITDLSAAGFRVPGALPWSEGQGLQVELWPEDKPEDLVAATATVVRRAQDTGLAFVELGSAEENRLADLVFGVREAALAARLTNNVTTGG